MEYNNIPRTGKWGDAATSIEENFLKSGIEIEKLKNANIRFKGYFQTIEALQTQHPSPTVGFTAWVGSPFPGTVYACQGEGEWVDTEDIPDTGSIALNGYLTTSDVITGLESEEETKPLSASMGKALDQKKVDKVEGSRLITEEEALKLSNMIQAEDVLLLDAEQVLTENQKEVLRTKIGAGTAEELNTALQGIEDAKTSFEQDLELTKTQFNDDLLESKTAFEETITTSIASASEAITSAKADLLVEIENAMESIPDAQMAIRGTEKECGTFNFLGDTHIIYDQSFELQDLPYTAGQTKEYIISQDPLGFNLYMNVEGLSVSSTKRLKSNFVTGKHKIAGIYVNDGMQTVIRVECTEDTEENLRAIVHLQFIKFSGDLIEFTITLPESVDPASVDVYFPALKYNKKIAVSWINDDIPAIYNFVIALINKKYMTGSATYHMGMPKSGGSVPSKPLEYTDGAGVRHRFATTIAVFSYLMAYMGYDGEDSSWPWTTNPELRYGIDFGLSLGWHDLKKSTSEPAGPSDQASFDALIAHNLAVIEEMTHFRPKFMAEPNGNHSYITWGQGNDQIQFQSAQASVVSQVFPFRPTMTLDKHAVTAIRYFYSSSVLTQVINKVATQIAGPEADREWLIVGNHGCAASIEKYFFELMESLYGASGSDEIWFPAMDEMFEYWWFKTYSNLSKVVNGNQISVRLHIPTSKDFYYKSLSVMVSGTGVTDAGDIAVSSSENCPGTSFAINNDEIMVNVNFGELLLERAEKYVSKFEASQEVTDKDDAQYFVQQLKPGVREPFQARIDALGSAPVLSAVVINTGAASTLNRVVSVALTTTGGIPTQYMISEASDFADASWVAYSTPITFSLEDVGGAHTVYVKVKNNFGESGTQSDSITYNRVDLELLTMIINNGDSNTQSRSATIAITHRGTYAATHYMASESASFVGASWMPIASSFPFDLSSGDGVKTVYVKLKNDVEESNALNDSITYAAIPFALTSVVINSGAASTTSRSVSITLGLSGDNLPTQYIVSENSDFSGASWQTYTSSVIPFELSNTGGVKTVYVQVKNATETSLVVSDTITFDKVALQLTLVNINAGAASTMNRTVSVALSYVGADAPTHYMISEASDLAGATWVAFTASPLSFQLSESFGSHTVYVKLKNAVEETDILSDSITLLEAVSLAGISINAGAASTSSQSVNVEFFYGGTPTHYMLSESATFAGASWIAFTTPATFSLSADYATKTVYAKLKDADTETPAVSSMISYEAAPQIGRKVAFSPTWNSFSTETLTDGTVVNLCGVVNYDGYVNRVLKDTAGVDWFTRVVREEELPANMKGSYVFQQNSYRAPTLSGNTGPYPDTYISRYMAVQTQNLLYPDGAGLLFTGVTPGTYQVRVLLSCKQNDTVNNQTSIKYVANDVVASPTGNIPLNNTSIFVDINDVVVGADGLLSFFVTHTVAVAASGFNFLEIIRTA